jgi:hypothetical protein
MVLACFARVTTKANSTQQHERQDGGHDLTRESSKGIAMR